MKYPKEYLDEIKTRLKVSTVVSKSVSLKKRGKEFIGLSPFKNEKTPSFTVNDEKGFYHCFSTSEHGNIFDFIMKTQNLKFGEAVKTLANYAGMQPYTFSKADEERENDWKNYSQIYKDYIEYHNEELLKNPDLNEVRDYLKNRNLNSNDVKNFDLGYVRNKKNFYQELLNKFKVSENDPACWHLPDLAEGGEAWALFKLKVNDLNENSKTIEVLRCNLSYETKVNDEVKIHNEGPIKLVLDRLSPSAFNAIAEDEEVKRRLDELTIANLQERAREASLRGDWVRVEQIIVEGRRVAGTNEWLQNSLSELAVFAKRQQRDQFSKEAIYSADKMNRRLSSSTEMHSMDYDMSAEIDKKAYLRRKVSRGKRMPRL